MAEISGYLEQRRAGWYAAVDVPPSLRPAVGRNRLRKSLRTRDKHVAKARLPKVLLELHQRIDEARRRRPETDPLTAEAMALRETLSAAREGKATGLPVVRFEDPDGEMHEEPDVGLLVDVIETRAGAIEREEGAARAKVFADLATGKATPTTLHLEEWLAEPGQRGALRPRTAADYRSILKTFAEWAAKEGYGAAVERVSRRVAGLYVQSLQRQSIGVTRIRSILTALVGYWSWMEKRGVIAEGSSNPWKNQAPRKPASARTEEKERAFTAEELATLLAGTQDPYLSDLMRVGALTGMRIEEIARLTVGMCKGDVIEAPGLKGDKLSVPRDVPVHPDLVPIIARRTKDRPASAFLFHEMGEPNKHGERSPSASKRFNRYRESLCVHEREEGQRRSRVNFHSFRRWFVTRAMEAGQQQGIIRAVIGHKQDPKDVLMRSYVTMGQLGALKRACVEAVRLPSVPAPAPATPQERSADLGE